MATEEVPQAIIREEKRREQAIGDECDALRMSRFKDGIIDVDEDGILVRIAPLDGSRQIVVPCRYDPVFSGWSISALSQPTRGVENECRYAPKVLLEKHVQRSRRNSRTLYSVGEEPSDRTEEDQFPQVVPSERASRVCRHGHLGPCWVWGWC
jgi:hypothetical protein